MIYNCESGDYNVSIVANSANKAARKALYQHYSIQSEEALGLLMCVTRKEMEPIYFCVSNLIADLEQNSPESRGYYERAETRIYE